MRKEVYPLSPERGNQLLLEVAAAAQSAAAEHTDIEVHFESGVFTTRKRPKKEAVSLELLTTSQLAAQLGVVEQDIINLVNRFDFIHPKKSTAFSSHETYVFTPEETELVTAIFRIQGKLHQPRRAAVQIVQHRDKIVQAAEALHAALQQFDDTPASWIAIVKALSLEPTLTKEELEVFLLIEVQKLSLEQVMGKLGITSEAKLRKTLESAQGKAGSAFFRLRNLSMILQ